MRKSQLALVEKLSLINLEELVEQGIITTTIQQLKQGQNSNLVLRALKEKFNRLALTQITSKEGLKVYTELGKPSIKVDTAVSSSTWF